MRLDKYLADRCLGSRSEVRELIRRGQVRVNGVIVKDTKSGHTLLNEVSKEFRFWNMWNDNGDKGYFCPEPMTAMINSANLSLSDDITGYCELKKGETFKCWQRFYTE